MIGPPYYFLCNLLSYFQIVFQGVCKFVSSLVNSLLVFKDLAACQAAVFLET